MKHCFITFLTILFGTNLCLAQEIPLPKVFDISNKFVFGKYTNGEWKMPAKYNGKYKVYRREMLIGMATIKSIPNKSEEPCAADFSYTEKFDNTNKVDYIAVEGTWNHLPRIPKKVNAQDPKYTKIVQEWCTSKNLKVSTFQITEALQVDVDNDNNPELIIVAKNIEETYGAVENNFSVILIQKDNQTLELCSFFMDSETAKNCTEDTPCFATIHRFIMCLDINNDSILEIITADQMHEGMGKTIYQWNAKDKKFIKILDWGCGV